MTACTDQGSGAGGQVSGVRGQKSEAGGEGLDEVKENLKPGP